MSCRTLKGEISPPGGIIHQNACWVFYLRAHPLLSPAQGLIVLRRHCENLSDLTRDELMTLGLTMCNTERALVQVIAPVKVHFGLYAEDVKHVHVHVMPRSSTMPAGNVSLALLGEWYKLLNRVGIRHAYEDSEVALIAEQLHKAFEKLSFSEDGSHSMR
ncbi:MAG TPA: HIT domain-containing protein [Aggregatilineales bacterium]|nr:HIT domain-containing protein [Aggregatilineales bacterium]